MSRFENSQLVTTQGRLVLLVEVLLDDVPPHEAVEAVRRIGMEALEGNASAILFKGISSELGYLLAEKLLFAGAIGYSLTGSSYCMIKGNYDFSLRDRVVLNV